MSSRIPLTATEAAKQLRVGPMQVVTLCRDGSLRASKPGKSWLIYQADIDAYIAAHTNAGAADAPESVA